MAPALAPLIASSSRSSSSSKRSSTPQVNAPKAPPPCKREREPPRVPGRFRGLEMGRFEVERVGPIASRCSGPLPIALGRAEDLAKGAPHQAR